MKLEVLDEIYAYWFGNADSPTEVDGNRMGFWMMQSDATDAEIRERFGDVIEQAAAVDWDLAKLDRRQAVALVVLFDQFPRNLYRTGPQAYAYDHLARDIVRKLTANGWDKFTAMERFLFGIVYTHHEDTASQDLAVLVAARDLDGAGSEGTRQSLGIALDQATRHRDLIRRFGRFPHRNEPLGRLSRPEEAAFLAEHGRGF